jgi:hypothetical protein
VSDEHPSPEEEKEIERSAGRAIAIIAVVAIVVMLLFWLVGYDFIRDAVS